MVDFKKTPTVNGAAVALARHVHPPGGPAAGLAVWLAADQLTGLANAAPVATWPDASGNGRDVSQATGGSQPTYRTNAINGRPAVRFDGTDDQMVTATFGVALAQPTTILVVCKLATTTGTLLDGAGCTDRQVIYANAGFWGLQSGGNVVSGVADTAAHVLCAEFGATDTLRVDGTQVLSGDSGAAAMGGLRLGAWCDGTSGFPPADFAEVLVYDRALTPAERQQLESALAAEYAIPALSPFAAATKWMTD